MTHDVLVGLVTGDPEDPQTRIAPGLDPGKISEAGGAGEAFFRRLFANIHNVCRSSLFVHVDSLIFM